MSALKTPAPDAPAEEWGELAERIPDWRWPWQCPHTEVCPPMPGFVWLEGAWCYTDDITPVARFSRTRAIPDPDHWAWEGWMLKLLGNLEEANRLSDALHLRRDQCPADAVIDAVVTGDPGRISRACIASAVALGRWPGEVA